MANGTVKVTAGSIIAGDEIQIGGVNFHVQESYSVAQGLSPRFWQIIVVDNPAHTPGQPTGPYIYLQMYCMDYVKVR